MVVAATAPDAGLDVVEDAAAAAPAGEGLAPPAASFLNHECFAGEGEAAEGDPAVVAMAAIFFECLCFPGLGEAPGLGLDVAVWPNTDETDKAANATRGMSFFITDHLSVVGARRQCINMAVAACLNLLVVRIGGGYPKPYYG